MNLPLVSACLAFLLASTVPVYPTTVHKPKLPKPADRVQLQTTAVPGTAVCLKLRVYQFERNDGGVPKLVRETTCSTVRPYLHKARAPKARLIPAD